MTAQAQPYKCREQPARQQEVTTTGAKRGAPRETRAPGKSGRSELTNEMKKARPQEQTETDGWQKERNEQHGFSVNTRSQGTTTGKKDRGRKNRGGAQMGEDGPGAARAAQWAGGRARRATRNGQRARHTEKSAVTPGEDGGNTAAMRTTRRRTGGRARLDGRKGNEDWKPSLLRLGCQTLPRGPQRTLHGGFKNFLR